METSQKSTPPLFQTSILSLVDSPAKPLASPDDVEGLMTLGELSSLISLGYCATRDPDVLYSRTSKAYLLTTAEKLSRSSLGFLPTSGTSWNGRFLVQRTSDSLRTESECSLWGVLEDQVDDRYYLSSEQMQLILSSSTDQRCRDSGSTAQAA